MKKIIAMFFAAALILTLAVPAFAVNSSFSDVKESDWFSKGVGWAVSRGITEGTSTTTFSPNQTCTVAQILTFLWRASGSPVVTMPTPFTDVADNAYYANAAAWAYDKGLVSGSVLNGDTPCIRSTVVSYLWQLAGKPVIGTSSFSDVPYTANYAQAVAWAVNKGVTSGTSDTTFSPNKTCTRAEIVTFLYNNFADDSFDLFSCCKNFALQKGILNGDFCMYQQSAEKYGGYDNEYFSISCWADSDMVEFCLHCPLSETQSHNFYLRMRGGYNGKYEYCSSKYYRDTGVSFREATGYIDPAVFSTQYPISCDKYEGSIDGQNEFMEDSRVGICDLIRCLKEFIKVENMECDFSAFEFVNF